jgi:recombination protein RecA
MVIINQTRAVINIGGRPQKNAPKEQAAGGNAIKFYTSLRFSLEITNQEGDDNRGSKGTDQIYTQNRVRVTCVKNKLAPPFMRGQIVIEYGKGINNLVSLGELAEAKLGIMSGAGFFKYQGDTDETSFSCRGRDAFQELLAERPALQTELEAKVIDAIRLEHAEMLGLDDIKVQGRAKEVESTAGPNKSIYLDDGDDTPSSVGETSHLADGTGMPVQDD